MGSCASVYKKNAGSTTTTSAMKLGVSFGSKTDKLVIPESPIKEVHVSPHPPINSFHSLGGKEEVFFDSRAWLDSDCEDDFFSVNGDFTPSRGSTPVHHNFSVGVPQVNKMPLKNITTPSSTTEPSPTGKKKSLSELFRESVRENQDVDDQSTSSNQNIPSRKLDIKSIMLDHPPNSSNGTPYASGALSVCSSERTANGDALIEKHKPMKSVQCCLPGLISCHSFSERKKKMSPAVSINGKA